MLKIITLNYPINADNIINSSLGSEISLLDGDVIVIDPGAIGNILYNRANRWRDGSFRISLAEGSDVLRDQFALRYREIETLLKNGKIVVAFLHPVFSVQGESRGKSTWTRISNYDWCPIPDRMLVHFIEAGTGKSITLKNPSHPFATYYKAYGQELQYQSYLGIEADDPNRHFLVNKTGNPVGISLGVYDGFMVFVPPPTEKTNDSKLVGVLIQCAKPILTKDTRTPEPVWSRSFPIPGESTKVEEIHKLQLEIADLNGRQDELQSQLEALTSYRALLYEQGTPLEEAVLRSFRLLDFQAERFQENDMEHDVILRSNGGIALAEVEGKDNDAIHIDKLDQLTRVVDEYYSKNNVYPHGILIGNAFRFTTPNERPDAFTEKVRISAERKNYALLTTAELFRVVVKILENASDALLKETCRKALFETKGKEVHFPV